MNPLSRYRLFIDKLAESQEAGNFDHVEANREALREAIADLMEYQYHLARFQGKARRILARHG